MTQVEEHLAGHGYGDAPAKVRRERVEDERTIVSGYVVGDEE
jgi:hypothetical protein